MHVALMHIFIAIIVIDKWVTLSVAELFNNEHKFHISQTDNIIRFNIIAQVDKQFMANKDRVMHSNYARLENRIVTVIHQICWWCQKPNKMSIVRFLHCDHICNFQLSLECHHAQIWLWTQVTSYFCVCVLPRKIGLYYCCVLYKPRIFSMITDGMHRNMYI